MNYNELREAVLHHAYQYYVLNDPEIADHDYDELFRSLQEAEEVEGETDKLTDKVRCGFANKSSFATFPHNPPMLSLDNVFTGTEFLGWGSSNELDLNTEVVASAKLDGASLSLVYEYGILVQALRRGDGKEGDDITATARRITGIPSIVEAKNTPRMVIRGEVVCPVFDAEFAGIYKNHRNFVSGSLNLKDPDEVVNRKLDFVAYRLYCDSSHKNYTDTLDRLERIGFNTVQQYGIVLSTVGDFSIRNARDAIKADVPVDGVVIMINNLELVNTLGTTSHHPRGAIAFKPRLEAVETTLIDVEFQVGKTGTITPVAIMEPVEIDGTIVQRCTLHNFREIKSLDIAINDKVKLIKSAFIIPKIVEVASRPTNRIAIRISECPSCGSQLKYSGAYLKCNNKLCGDQAVQALLRFAQVVKLDGFGKATMEKLVTQKITRISDLLTRDLGFLERLTKSEKVAAKLFASLQERPKAITFVQALASLNIPLLNESSAQKLVDAGITDVFELRNESLLQSIKGFGPTKAEKIANWVRDNDSEVGRLYELLPLTITPKDTVTSADNITVVITGKLKLSKSQAKSELAKRGYTLANSVTKKTDILIVGDRAGKDKLAKAKQLGVSIVKYEESAFKEFI